MRTELIIDGNAVYEIDLDCMEANVKQYIEQYSVCTSNADQDAPEYAAQPDHVQTQTM